MAIDPKARRSAVAGDPTRSGKGKQVNLDPTRPPAQGPASAYTGQGVPPRPASTTVRDIHGNNFYSPNQPIAPFGPPQVTEPRWFDYLVGRNLNFTERQGYWKKLRGLADSLGVLRALIETRKDQFLRIPWEIQLKDDSKENPADDPRCKELKEFFKKPDRENRWHTWVRMILEDLFVCDNATLYIQRSRAGTPYSVAPLVGDTIFPVTDAAPNRPTLPTSRSSRACRWSTSRPMILSTLRCTCELGPGLGARARSRRFISKL